MKKSGLFAASVASTATGTAITSASSSNYGRGSKPHPSNQVNFSSCLFAASVAATATGTAITSASSSNYGRGSKPHPSNQEEEHRSERFAPRFDGLRFIETLVTAHR